MRRKPLWALLGLLFAPVETASASLYVNDGSSGNCSQMLGSGLLGIQIPITIISHSACNANSLSTLISAGAGNGTLALNGNGAFLIGNLHLNGMLDLNNHALSNLAAGVSATDAVNLGQLTATANSSATILGGGATVNANGTINLPTYSVQNTAAHDVGTALSALDAGINTNSRAIGNLGSRVQAVDSYFVSNGLNNGADNAHATGVNAVAMGPLANAQGSGSIVIGNSAKDGTAAVATGNAVVIGNHAQVSATPGSNTTGAIAIGDTASAFGNASVALGQGAAARNTESFALGASANATGTGATAVGYTATTNGNNAVAIGRNANATGVGTTAIGFSATTNGANAMAIGNGAHAPQANSIALGVNAVADRANVVSIGSASAQRQLTYVAAGTQNTDAVNVGQLTPALTALGATFNADGTVSAPTYTVQSTPVRDVGSAFKLLDDGVTANTTGIRGLDQRVGANEGAINGLLAGTAGLVQQANTSAAIAVGANSGGNSINITGQDGHRRITGVADATQSNDAVNLQQLQALQSEIGDVSALAVQYDDAGKSAITLGGAGATTPVTLRNVANGQNVNDAANFGQLHGTAQSVADALGGNAHVNADGTLSAPAYTVQGRSVQDVGSAMQALDDGVIANATGINGLDVRVTANEGAISSLLTGTVGLVQQANASAVITVGAASGGGSISVAGQDGDRRITGVADATESSDAVNLQQLQALQSEIGDVGALAVQYDDAGKSAITLGGVGAATSVTLHNVANGQNPNDAANFGQLSGTAESVANAFGGNALVAADGTLVAPAYTVQSTTVHDVGSALGVLDDGVTANTTGISGLDRRVSANEGAINGLLNGTSGLVQQADTAAPVTVAATSGGSVVDVAGTDGDRRLSGLADGTQDNDAANIGQLKALQNQFGDITALAVTYDDASQASITFGGRTASAPVALRNVADGMNPHDAVNVGQLSGLQSALQGQIASVNTQIGALDSRVSTLENGGAPSPSPGGPDPAPNPDYSGGVTVGNNSTVGHSTAAAVGNNAQAAGVHGTALGSDAYAASYHGTALGGKASAASDGGVAVGANANVVAVAGTAVGEGATVTAAANNAVALGAGSIATQANSVSVGSAGNERIITNVAPGVDATDAVNVSQLQAAQSWAQSYTDQQANALHERITRMGRRADAGTAAAIAMTNIPQAYAPDQSSLGAGLGSFRGQAAVAVGMSTVTPGGRWVLKASLSGTSQGDVGVGAGAAMVW